uniref:Uncharacterized protein n=1 Tax=Arundo donax TaxID=35708 RepID=A0A0A9GVI1_ARUDO
MEEQAGEMGEAAEQEEQRSLLDSAGLDG